MSNFSGIDLQGFTLGYFVISFVVSTIGFSYFMYGKKNQRTMAMISGVILLVFPYFVHDIISMLAIALLLCVLPFVIRV